MSAFGAYDYNWILAFARMTWNVYLDSDSVMPGTEFHQNDE